MGGAILTENILFGRAILVYIPALGQGDIASGPYIYIPILPDPSAYIMFIIPKTATYNH